jgi:hypothetical protein
VLQHCGIDKLHGFPPPRESRPVYPIPVAKQIIWQIAEVNFRFELYALDRRASLCDQADMLKYCFAGGMLLHVPLELSRHGLASQDLTERHRYHSRLANLMLDWSVPSTPRPAIFRGIASQETWSHQEMEDLEKAVTGYYTQCFFELFGRCASTTKL